FTIVQIARRSTRHEAMPLTAVQVAASAAMFALAMAVALLCVRLMPAGELPDWARLEARPLVMTPRLGAELVWMALVCTVLTFAGQTWAMARMSATHAAIVFALEPVF